MIPHKLVKIIKLSGESKRLFAEALVTLMLSYFGFKFLPFRRLKKYLGDIDDGSRLSPSFEQAVVQNISNTIGAVCKNSPFKATCFPKALATKIMLNRRNIPCTLHLGVCKDPSGLFKGHAWLTYEGLVLTGEKGHHKFQVIQAYS